MVPSRTTTARRTAWLLAVAVFAAAPGVGHAATVSAAVERQLAPLVTSAPHLAGPLRLLSAYGTLTSARRSIEHNRRVGGATNSYHLLGNAIDVQRRPGITHQALDAALRRAGYLLAESIDEIDHSHFAFLPGRITPIPAVEPVAPVAVASKMPPLPRVAADLHGTLLIDGGRSGPGELASGGPAGSSGGLASAK